MHPEVLMAAAVHHKRVVQVSMNLQSVLPALNLKPHLHFEVQGFAEPCNRVQY